MIPPFNSTAITRHPTEFEESVYQATTQIPEGKVTTYRELAAFVGCGSCQAVGQALKRNPYAPEVPCHRVISSELTIGGFSGERSGKKIDRKLRLLREEGVDFDHGKLADEGRLFQFSNADVTA